MNNEVNTLQNLKISLDLDVRNIPPLLIILEKHHDFLAESLSVLVDPDASAQDKKLHLMRFSHVINMHGRAEEETLYLELIHSGQREARFQAHVSKAELDLGFQLAEEIRDLEREQDWSDEVDAKTKVMASLVRIHLREEERLLFPVAKKTLAPEILEHLTPLYLKKCIQYLELEMGLDHLGEVKELSSESIKNFFASETKMISSEINVVRH